MQDDLASYFARCSELTAKDPKAALEVVLEAPDRVKSVAESLGGDFEDCYLRSLGLAGTALCLGGYSSVADSVFSLGSELEASSSERGGFVWRQALHELYRSNWETARGLSSEAVAIFEGAPSLRDDCSRAAASAMRGMVEAVAYQEGVEGFERDVALRYYRRALAAAPPAYKMSRLAAVAGMGRILVSGWMGAARPSVSEVADLASELAKIRADLRRVSTPYQDLLDLNVRWLLGLSLHRLFGGFARGTEKMITSARKDLRSLGRPSDLRWITLDYQWCLIADGRFGAALKECETLAVAGMPASLLRRWEGAIRQRLVTDRIARLVFASAGGARAVISPQGPALLGEGWDKAFGAGHGKGKAGGMYGF